MDEFDVLIVDDEEELIKTIAERLYIRGINTRITTDGNTALKIIEDNPPKVVVLDVMMPGLGGIEILKIMKEKKIDLPVILLTGYGSNEQAEEGMKQGAFDYLMKPCDINNLIDKIKKAAINL